MKLSFTFSWHKSLNLGWFPCDRPSRVHHTSRFKMCSRDQGRHMETPPTNARRSWPFAAKQSRETKTPCQRVWDAMGQEKKTGLHHLKCDFPFFPVDSTASFSLVQGVFVPFDC